MISLGDAVLNLGVDAKKLTSGLASAGTSIKNGLTKAAKAGALAIVGMTTAVYSFAAASLTAFAKAGDDIGKMATRTGMSAEALSQLKHAAELSGTSLEDFYTGYRGMSRKIEAANEGNKAAAQSFKDIRINVSELKGLAPQEIFMKLADGVAGVEDPMKRTAIAMELFGKSGTNMLPMLMEGSAGIKTMMQDADFLGISFSDAGAKLAEQLTDAMDRTKKSFQGVIFAIAEELAPRAIEAFNTITDWVATHRETIVEIFMKIMDGLGGILSFFSERFMQVMPIVIEYFNGWVQWFQENWEQLTAVVEIGVNILVNIFTAFGHLLYAALLVVSAILAGFLDGVVNVWANATGHTRDGAGGMLGMIEDFAQRLESFSAKVADGAGRLSAYIFDNWNKIKDAVSSGTIVSLTEILRFITGIVRFGNVVFTVLKSVSEVLYGVLLVFAGVFAGASVIVLTAVLTIVGAFQFLKDTIKSIYTNLTDSTKSWSEAFLGIWKDMKESFWTSINAIISPLRTLYNWIVKVLGGGNDLNNMPLPNPGDNPGQNAAGTPFWKGGLSLVGEEGPELIDMPRGSKVFNNSDTQDMMGGKSVNITSPINIVINGMQKTTAQVAEELGAMVQSSLVMAGDIL